MTFISVCIPTYSRLNYLKETVQSILEQTYKNFEICISQDPKKDGPDEEIRIWCTQQEQTDTRIRYHLNSSNLGLAGNWNQLVALAKGDYLIILGDDDTLAPSYLEKLVSKVNKLRADVCFCDQYFIDSDSNIDFPLTEWNSNNYSRSSLPSGILKDPINTVLQNSVPMSAALIKKEWLLKFPFDPKLNTPELEVFLKIAINKGVFYYEQERLAYYRVHPLSATSSGLRVHHFIRNLIDIEVPATHEESKSQLVSSQITVAVNRYLLENDKQGAKFLLKSKYYPSKPLYKFVQTFLANAPHFLTRLILK